MTTDERARRAKAADDETCVMLLAVLARIRLHMAGSRPLGLEPSAVERTLTEAGL